MCRYSDGSSFLRSLCSVSEISEGLRRRHELHGGILETFKYQHRPQPEGSRGKLAHPCNCQQILNLLHRQNQSPKVVTVRSRHPIPVTVGTFEIAKC